MEKMYLTLVLNKKFHMATTAVIFLNQANIIKKFDEKSFPDVFLSQMHTLWDVKTTSLVLQKYLPTYSLSPF